MSFIDKLEGIASSALERFKPFNPQTLNDELALKTDWQPMKKGGANFATHSLKQTTDRKLEYKPTLMAYLFPAIFISAFSVGGYVAAMQFSDKFGNLAYLIGGAFVLVPIGLGIFLLKTYMKPKVFDTNLGLFYKGKLPVNYHNADPSNKLCRLDEVYALQLLRYISTSTSSDSNTTRTYYELNMVLNDTYRINIASNTDKYRILKEANQIASTIDVPVWDAISR